MKVSPTKLECVNPLLTCPPPSTPLSLSPDLNARCACARRWALDPDLTRAIRFAEVNVCDNINQVTSHSLSHLIRQWPQLGRGMVIASSEQPLIPTYIYVFSQTDISVLEFNDYGKRWNALDCVWWWWRARARACVCGNELVTESSVNGTTIVARI